MLFLHIKTPSMHGLLDEESAYETQRKFNALTNELIKRYEVQDAEKAAAPKKIAKAVDPA